MLSRDKEQLNVIEYACQSRNIAWEQWYCVMGHRWRGLSGLWKPILNNNDDGITRFPSLETRSCATGISSHSQPSLRYLFQAKYFNVSSEMHFICIACNIYLPMMRVNIKTQFIIAFGSCDLWLRSCAGFTMAGGYMGSAVQSTSYAEGMFSSWPHQPS